MIYYVNIKGREFQVDLQDGGGRLAAGIGNERFTVDCAEIEEGMKYSVLIDGESFNVSLNPSSHSMDLILGGHLYRAQVLDEREKGALALQDEKGSTGRQVVQSVMPGIVRKVFVSEGDEVASGMPLLILEAMKMENELCAEETGVVAKVHVSEGQTVNSSDPLVTIE
jgi:biotin carboxyl carrier protein